MQPFAKTARWGALALVLPALASCSEYLARRDTISVYGGDAVMGNRVVQMVDPWPPAAADRTIAYDGTVMTRAVRRYHEGRVIQPSLGGTSSAYQESQPNAQAQGNDLPPANAPTQAAGPTK
jgi:hypothetical protein